MQYLSTQPGFSPHLRHRFNITATSGAALLATGIRLRMPITNSIDELEVNTPAADTFDAAFGMELTGTDILPPAPKLAFNEVSAANANPFWFEIINYGDAEVDLLGVQVLRSGTGSAVYNFPSQILSVRRNRPAEPGATWVRCGGRFQTFSLCEWAIQFFGCGDRKNKWPEPVSGWNWKLDYPANTHSWCFQLVHPS